MPTYDYQCPKCSYIEEIRHSIKEDPNILCPNCKKVQMTRIISDQFYVTKLYHVGETIEDYKEKEHRKKVKDPERAIRMRKKAFGHAEVGDPKMISDPKHIIRKKRVIEQKQIEIDKQEFIKAAAKNPLATNIAKKIIQK